MAFNKLFHKKDSIGSEPFETPKLNQFSKYTKKLQMTPTGFTDVSLKGEQKRTALLETQLKDVSFTASKAYDTIEELNMRNEMLQDQVVQQKMLIEDLMKQLDVNKDKLQLKSKQDDEFLKTLQEKSESKERITDLEYERNELIKDIKLLENELIKYKRLYEGKEKQLKASSILEHEKSVLDNTLTLNSVSAQQQDTEIVLGLKKRISELELALEYNNSDYQGRLSNLKNTIMIIRDNKKFLSEEGNFSDLFVDTSRRTDDSNGEAISEGDTFVMSNIQFLR